MRSGRLATPAAMIGVMGMGIAFAVAENGDRHGRESIIPPPSPGEDRFLQAGIHAGLGFDLHFIQAPPTAAELRRAALRNWRTEKAGGKAAERRRRQMARAEGGDA